MGNGIYKIIVTDIKRPFEDILKDHERNLSIQIINAICEAIDNGESRVEVAKIITPFHNITLKSEEKQYISTLEINKNTLIEYEDYEICAKAVRGIEKMKERNKIKQEKKYLEDKK
jgi:hypothetical protein